MFSTADTGRAQRSIQGNLCFHIISHNLQAFLLLQNNIPASAMTRRNTYVCTDRSNSDRHSLLQNGKENRWELQMCIWSIRSTQQVLMRSFKKQTICFFVISLEASSEIILNWKGEDSLYLREFGPHSVAFMYINIFISRTQPDKSPALQTSDQNFV